MSKVLFAVGDRIIYSKTFLMSVHTGITNPIWFRKGTVIYVAPELVGKNQYLRVLWDDALDGSRGILSCNCTRI